MSRCGMMLWRPGQRAFVHPTVIGSLMRALVVARTEARRVGDWKLSDLLWSLLIDLGAAWRDLTNGKALRVDEPTVIEPTATREKSE